MFLLAFHNALTLHSEWMLQFCFGFIKPICIYTSNEMKKLWTLWAKALGEKAFADNKDADKVALIRTIIVLVNFVTCFFIMANVIRHW